MLFYERRRKRDCEIVLEPSSVIKGQNELNLVSTVMPLVHNSESNKKVKEIREMLAEVSKKIEQALPKSVSAEEEKKDASEEPKEEETPFLIMVDTTDGSVTLRDLDSVEQARLPLDELIALVENLAKGTVKWADVTQLYGKYPGDKLTNRINVTYDKKLKEFKRHVRYREGADNEAPNDIYKKVFEDNKKFTFENDIYSQEFFDFILQILSSVAKLDDGVNDDEVKNIGLKIGKKAAFEILARCFHNVGIDHVA